MKIYKLSRGLKLPISNKIDESIIDLSGKIKEVAITGDDFQGLRPKFLLKEGDKVKKGQPVFMDKKRDGVFFSSPVSGIIKEIVRGEKRKFLHISISAEGNESEIFPAYSESNAYKLEASAIENILVSSGMWALIKERPFGKTPIPGSIPSSIFVNMADNSPYAPDINIILKDNEPYLKMGLSLLSKFAKVNLCVSDNCNYNAPETAEIKTHVFKGRFPSGLSGTHIHFIDPVKRGKSVWQIDFQSVISMAKLILTGEADFTKIISIGGEGLEKNIHIKTAAGAKISELISEYMKDGDNRIISGSLLFGRCSTVDGYLGAFHNSITVIPEGRKRKFMGWVMPGLKMFSTKNIYVSSFLPVKPVINTALNGSERPIMPVGGYEDVCPLDIFATHLLKSIAVNDVENAEKLGVLELLEEDMGAFNFVCPGKVDHSINLRTVLDLIEKEI